MMQTIVIAMQQQANDSINNIQLVQQQDDNIIPVAPQLDDIPDEQPLTVTTKPVVTPDNNRDVTTIPSSTEKPVAILEKTNVPAKLTVAEKRVSKSAEKPFWLQSAMAKPATGLKKSNSTKNKSTSNGRPNPSPLKKVIVLRSSVKKPIIKSTIKPATKTIIKPKAKPKAVLPPPNDY
jgi:hypothetical protein